MKKTENIILKLSFEFALQIIEYVEELEERRKFVIANQLLKSGTSIGASVREAQNAESLPDFIHKFKISAKEGEETEYWLMLCSAAKNYPDTGSLLSKLSELKKIINRIIASSKNSRPNV